LINYGSKWGANQHNSSGWIVDIEKTVFENNIQRGNDNGSLIKDCSSPFVLNKVRILNNVSSGSYPIIDVWKGSAGEVSDGDAPNHDAILTIINSDITGNDTQRRQKRYYIIRRASLDNRQRF
jgi:hypothetical protein